MIPESHWNGSHLFIVQSTEWIFSNPLMGLNLSSESTLLKTSWNLCHPSIPGNICETFRGLLGKAFKEPEPALATSTGEEKLSIYYQHLALQTGVYRCKYAKLWHS